MKNIFELIKQLNKNEMELFLVLSKLSEKYGYTYISIKNLAKKLERDEKEITSILYSLVKKRALFYIDIKEENKVLEKRFYTDKFKYFRDSKNIKELKPTFKKEVKDKTDEIEKNTEIKNKEKEEELKNLVNEYYSNMSSIEYFEKYSLAEERYKKLMKVPKEEELNEFQNKIFEGSVEIYIKEIIKEKLAKELGIEIKLYFN